MSGRLFIRSLRSPQCSLTFLARPALLQVTPDNKHNVHQPQARGLLTPITTPTHKTISDVVSTLSHDIIAGVPTNYDPELFEKKRSELMKILPENQEELPSRRMLDSYDSVIIPIASDTALRDHYITYDGGVRVGRLLEDMDLFAVHLGNDIDENAMLCRISHYYFQCLSMF